MVTFVPWAHWQRYHISRPFYMPTHKQRTTSIGDMCTTFSPLPFTHLQRTSLRTFVEGHPSDAVQLCRGDGADETHVAHALERYGSGLDLSGGTLDIPCKYKLLMQCIVTATTDLVEDEDVSIRHGPDLMVVSQCWC